MKHKFFGSSTIILMVITLLLVAVSPVAAFPAETVRVWVSYHNGKAGEVLKTLNENKANIIYDFRTLGLLWWSCPHQRSAASRRTHL